MQDTERPPQYVITLVHGTYARGAPWTKEGSLFRARLEAALGPHLIYSRFEWSGGNSHQARQEAAEDLAAHIQKCARTNPQAEHYLVCHSHGGNVALRAVSLNDTARLVRGIVTLGTPFITFRRRDPTATLKALAWAAPLSASIIAMPLLVRGLGFLEDRFSKTPGGVIFLGIPFVGFAIYALFSKVRSWSKAQLPEWVVRKQVASELKLKSVEVRNDLLVLFVKHDEAGTWLSSLGLIGGLYHQLHIVNRALMIMGFLATIAAEILSMNIKQHEAALHRLSVEAWFLFIGLTVLYVISSPLLGIFPWLIRGHRFGFGGETLLDNMLNKITAERWPITEGKLAAVEISPKSYTGLRHSSFYDDQFAARVIVEWVRNRNSDLIGFEGSAKRPPYLKLPASLASYVASALIVSAFMLFRWAQIQ